MWESFSKMHIYFEQHQVLSHISHISLGFGIALLLQNYLKGNGFLPMSAGWAFVGIWLGIHILAYVS
ncbi:MAG TPA: hypothetical protein VFF04_06285 [Candidatus Babeliales bacterium]|nr:hypothetical protein [Candidatus Babeliales bacterium]